MKNRNPAQMQRKKTLFLVSGNGLLVPEMGLQHKPASEGGSWKGGERKEGGEVKGWDIRVGEGRYE